MTLATELWLSLNDSARKKETSAKLGGSFPRRLEAVIAAKVLKPSAK